MGTSYAEVCQASSCDSKASRLIEIPIYGHEFIKEKKLMVCESCATKFIDKEATE
jgi:hypothetical protein